VPTLKLKLVATTLSGALMGMAGAPFPYTSLSAARLRLRARLRRQLDRHAHDRRHHLLDRTADRCHPVATLQQWATVTISSELSLLIVGLLPRGFRHHRPHGIVGLVQGWLRKAK